MKSFRRVAAASNKTRVRGDHGYAGGKKQPKEKPGPSACATCCSLLVGNLYIMTFVGLVLAMLICVPDWPIFNRNPTPWLGEIASARTTVAAADEGDSGAGRCACHAPSSASAGSLAVGSGERHATSAWQTAGASMPCSRAPG